MGSAVHKAFLLILSLDKELLNILGTTARVSLSSSILALLIGVPIGLWLGSSRFPGRGALVVINRTPLPAEKKASLVIREDAAGAMGALRVP